MPKLYSANDLLKAFQRAGFYKVSQKGSHIKLRGIWRDKFQTVIVPNHKEIALGTFRSILNQASMTIDDLKIYLR